MKKGDKLICIKDLSKFVKENFDREEQEIHYKYRNSEISDGQYKKLTINLYKKKEKSRQDRSTFTIGKVYTIDHVNDSSIDILNNFNYVENFSILENGKLSVLANYHYDEYFITLIQARKRKLDDLADENFSTFLKKLKK